MANITAALVKELRTKSGAGMMDCKRALTETDGDVEAAIDWLRKKGHAAAAKKAGRVAAEGLVAFAIDGGKGAIAEVNAETDFVARNEQFQFLARSIAELALANDGNDERVLAAPFPGTGRTVAEELTHAIATIGENMNFRRTAVLGVSPGLVAGYVHNAAAPGLGKTGVLVAMRSEGDAEKLRALGKQLAMHVVATAPLAVDVADLDASAVERERSVLADQARATGKPENIVEKMVDGRMRKYYQDVVLLEQAFVMDLEVTVRQMLEAAAKDVGAPIEVTGFVRFALGEGIEKNETDFAAEVAATAAG